MYTCNITFVVSPDKENELLNYIRGTLIPVLFSEDTPARSPELKKLIEAGGEIPGEDHGLSIALSGVLPTEETAHLWHDHTLLPALSDFYQQFGTHALYFVTLLLNLSL